MTAIKAILGDLYKGPDGETISLGRVYTVPVMIAGLVYPFMLLWEGHPPSYTEMSLGLGTVVATLTVLITGTNHIDTPGATLFGGGKA